MERGSCLKMNRTLSGYALSTSPMTGATLLQNGHSKSANSIIVTGALAGPLVDTGDCTEPSKLPSFPQPAPKRYSCAVANAAEREPTARPGASVQNKERIVNRQTIDASLRRDGGLLTNEGSRDLRRCLPVEGVFQLWPAIILILLPKPGALSPCPTRPTLPPSLSSNSSPCQFLSEMGQQRLPHDNKASAND